MGLSSWRRSEEVGIGVAGAGPEGGETEETERVDSWSGVLSRRRAVRAAESRSKVMIALLEERERVREVILPQKEKKLVSSPSEVSGEMLLTRMVVIVAVLYVWCNTRCNWFWL